ncbi:MAG: alpha/beta fold hydrolase [Rickettsiales bacterium]
MPGGKGEGRYARYPSYAAWRRAMLRLRPQGVFARIAVGWSLGAQVAARAVADGTLCVDVLVLIGAPFRFVDERSPFASEKQCLAFAERFRRAPDVTLRSFISAVADGNEKATEIRAFLRRNPSRDGAYPYPWLVKELFRFDGARLRVPKKRMPKRVLVIHGENDKVVAPAQAALWKNIFPHAKIYMVPNQGHAVVFANGEGTPINFSSLVAQGGRSPSAYSP